MPNSIKLLAWPISLQRWLSGIGVWGSGIATSLRISFKPAKSELYNIITSKSIKIYLADAVWAPPSFYRFYFIHDLPSCIVTLCIYFLFLLLILFDSFFRILISRIVSMSSKKMLTFRRNSDFNLCQKPQRPLHIRLLLLLLHSDFNAHFWLKIWVIHNTVKLSLDSSECWPTFRIPVAEEE